MQGRIGVESEEGEGATFWFTALFTLGSEEFFEKTEKPEDDTEDCSLDAEVLVAEDNLTNQIVARGLLEQLGCRVTMVENGREAVAQVLENSFDIVFMDCQMPIMDGYEATRRIRAAEKESGRPSVVIVALTAHAMKGDREHCLAVGMDDYLSKPFREDQLTDLLGRWLSCKNTDEPGGQGTQETSTQSISESEEEQPEFDNQVLENYRQIQRPDQPDIINRLITIYQKSSLTLLAEIDSAVQASDDKRLWHAAHSLKSSSANLGALKLARLCEELEMQGRAGRLEQAAELAASVRHEYERTETWLDQKNSL
jgi:CheY-like chemotaxis protein